MDEQKGLFAFLDKYLMGPMSVVAQYKIVRAITAAGVASIPFTIVGSMFLVFHVLPDSFNFWPGLRSFYEATFYKFSDLYMLANNVTMGALSLYFVLSMGYELTKIYADEEELNLNPLNGAMLSLFAFLMAIPQLIFKAGSITSVTNLKEGEVVADGWAIADGVSRFGTTGIFTAIIMAIVSVLLYRMCVKHNWVIKMPEAVPEGVSRGFTALIPGFVIAVVVLFINGIFVMLGTDIFQVISAPFGFVRDLTDTWVGIMVIYLLTQALWSVGIHGANTIFAPFINPIALVNMATNASEGTRYIVAGEWSNMFVIAGGSGATLGLCIWLATRAKSEQLKAIGKASIVPGIFNINEPLIFGIPIIYNPSIFVPFLLAPMTSATIYFFAMKLNLVKAVFTQVAWPTPIGLGAFTGTGDWRAIILAFICAIAAFLVYWPFIRRYDRNLFEKEQGIRNS